MAWPSVSETSCFPDPPYAFPSTVFGGVLLSLTFLPSNLHQNLKISHLPENGILIIQRWKTTYSVSFNSFSAASASPAFSKTTVPWPRERPVSLSRTTTCPMLD